MTVACDLSHNDVEARLVENLWTSATARSTSGAGKPHRHAPTGQTEDASPEETMEVMAEAHPRSLDVHWWRLDSGPSVLRLLIGVGLLHHRTL